MGNVSAIVSTTLHQKNSQKAAGNTLFNLRKKFNLKVYHFLLIPYQEPSVT